MTTETVKLPVRCVVPIEKMEGGEPEETDLKREMARQAESSIRRFDWCKSIAASYYGVGVGNVVAVFLPQTAPNRPPVDGWLWVIVGDLAFAYLELENSLTASVALEGDIDEMSRWASLAELRSCIGSGDPCQRALAAPIGARAQATIEVLRE